MLACPNCGQQNRDAARFCDACGASLAEPAPAREERKVVTVLFADLVGFTSRAERMDPEDVRALLAPYYVRLRAELERFGGTVEKFIGDAAMALFGAPIAHEDDPERAVRAALAIRRWITEEGEDLLVRMAVNTGVALVSLDARAHEARRWPRETSSIRPSGCRLQRLSTAFSSASRPTGRRAKRSSTTRLPR
jgi:class 3 adenylate cyclase